MNHSTHRIIGIGGGALGGGALGRYVIYPLWRRYATIAVATDTTWPILFACGGAVVGGLVGIAATKPTMRPTLADVPDKHAWHPRGRTRGRRHIQRATVAIGETTIPWVTRGSLQDGKIKHQPSMQADDITAIAAMIPPSRHAAIATWMAAEQMVAQYGSLIAVSPPEVYDLAQRLEPVVRHISADPQVLEKNGISKPIADSIMISYRWALAQVHRPPNHQTIKQMEQGV